MEFCQWKFMVNFWGELLIYLWPFQHKRKIIKNVYLVGFQFANRQKKNSHYEFIIAQMEFIVSLIKYHVEEWMNFLSACNKIFKNASSQEQKVMTLGRKLLNSLILIYKKLSFFWQKSNQGLSQTFELFMRLLLKLISCLWKLGANLPRECWELAINCWFWY